MASLEYERKLIDVLQELRSNAEFSTDNEYELTGNPNGRHQFRVCKHSKPDEIFLFAFQMVVCGFCGDFVMCNSDFANCECRCDYNMV
jgi:hypothetical protein